MRPGSICRPLCGLRCWAVEDEHLCSWLSGRGGRRCGWIVNVGVHDLFQSALDGVDKCFCVPWVRRAAPRVCSLGGQGRSWLRKGGVAANSETVTGESVAAIRVGMTACQADHEAAACRLYCGAHF